MRRDAESLNPIQFIYMYTIRVTEKGGNTLEVFDILLLNSRENKEIICNCQAG